MLLILTTVCALPSSCRTRVHISDSASASHYFSAPVHELETKQQISRQPEARCERSSRRGRERCTDRPIRCAIGIERKPLIALTRHLLDFGERSSCADCEGQIAGYITDNAAIVAKRQRLVRAHGTAGVEPRGSCLDP